MWGWGVWIGDTSGAVSEPQTGPVARYTGTSLLALKGDPTTGPAFVLHLFFCIIQSPALAAIHFLTGKKKLKTRNSVMQMVNVNFVHDLNHVQLLCSVSTANDFILLCF